MRFDERFLDEIKGRLRLSDVIGRSVQLRRAGREYVGLSPFTKEKTPSFYVNDEKGFFHDFSSGKHGDLIAFLQETERLSFREAIERLAGEAGVPLPSPDPREAERERERQDLYGWMEEAARWFEAQLRRPKGEAARRYLDGRALPEDMRTRFRLGYAPADRSGLKDVLVAKGARPGELVEAGLLIQPEDGGGAPYDRFRDRIMFPITDGRGRIISFGGRALDPQARAKYLNGPETSLFHKGSSLYLLPEARKLLHQPGEEDADLVVVEGYMDAIACQRAGIAAVAPLGTALTEEQMAALWRLAPEPVLCFDGDAAGQRAAHKAIDRALPLLKPGRSLRFALPTGGKDPDEVLREKGAAALKAQLADVRPLADVLYEREQAAAEPLDTPERRAGLKLALRKLAGAIADPDLAKEYGRFLLARYDLAAYPAGAGGRDPSDAGRQLSLAGWKKRRATVTRATPEAVAASRRLAASLPPFAAAAADGLMLTPSVADDWLETVDVQHFGEESLAGFAHAFVSIRIRHEALDGRDLRRELAHRGLAAEIDSIRASAPRAHAPFLRSDCPEAEARELWSHLVAELTQLASLERTIQSIMSEISTGYAASADSLFEGAERVMGELMAVKAERDALRRDLRTGTFWERALSNVGSRSLH